MFNIVITMHAAFNSAVELGNAFGGILESIGQDNAECQDIAESRDITQPQSITNDNTATKSVSCTQVNTIKDDTNKPGVMMVVPDTETDVPLDNEHLAAPEPGHQAAIDCSEKEANNDKKSRNYRGKRNTKAARNRNTRYSKSFIKPSEPIVYTNGTTPYRVENIMPEGALGLAASRWASKEPSKPSLTC